MQIWKKSTPKTQPISVLLYDGFSNHCLANTIEPLRAANMLSGQEIYAWTVLSLTGAPARSSSGLEIAATGKLSDHSGDLLFVMPSYGFREHAHWQSQAALRAAANRFEVIAGLDTGAWLLAAAGLLDQHRATIHWEELTGFAERFPDIETVRERYVIDGKRITCSGALAAFDLVHHLISERHGHALSLEVARLLMASSSGAERKSTSSDRAVAIMETYLERPLPIERIARLCGQTQKTLEQRMQSSYGASPRTVYRRLRLNHARKLVQETAMSISEIALRSGYQNPSALTRAFKAEFGLSPRDLRRES